MRILARKSLDILDVEDNNAANSGGGSRNRGRCTLPFPQQIEYPVGPLPEGLPVNSAVQTRAPQKPQL